MERLKTEAGGRVILPQPQEISKREKEDAMGAYLMMFAAMGAGFPFPLLNLLASIIYFSINKKKSRYVAFHSFQSLITQIPISVLNGVLLFWFIRILIMGMSLFNLQFFIYLGFVILWNLLYIILSITASVRARRGQLYYMLFFGAISFDKYYGEAALNRQNLYGDKKIEPNRPPSGY